jgi:hypothetical protein
VVVLRSWDLVGAVLLASGGDNPSEAKFGRL